MWQDIRFALRTARQSPGFVLAAVGTLSLGIGAVAAIFSILSGVLLRPLPFAHPERLVQFIQFDPHNPAGAVYYRDLVTARTQGHIFDEIVTYGNGSRNLIDEPEPERIQTVRADRNLFRVLGVAPIVGRTFTDDDPLTVAVLSASLWKRRFGADPACVGRKITLDGELYTVLGVMPDNFQFPYRSARTEMWIPWTMPPERATNPNARVDLAVGRLTPGVTLEVARRQMAALDTRFAAEDANRIGRSTLLTPLAGVVSGSVRAPLVTLFGAVALVLLIACANVANLLLARASRRSHEIAVRAALGASRGCLLQQFLTESLILSLAGALGGLWTGIAATRLIVSIAAARLPRAAEIGMDWRVFLFLTLAAVVSGLTFGILPALSASRVSPDAALKQAGRGAVQFGIAGWNGRWLRDGLVVGEVALSFLLLVSAGMLLRGFVRLQETPSGMVTDDVLTMRLTVAFEEYRSPGSFGRYLHELENRVHGVPGVRSAGFIQYLPLQNFGWNASFTIQGQAPASAEQTPRTELRYVSPGYFETLHIPILQGRNLNERDTSDAPRVILVNEALALRYFPGQNPQGRVTDRGTIIGVVGDVRTTRLDRPATPEIYYSFVQNAAATSDAGVSLVVLAHAHPESVAKDVVRAIQQVNPRQVVYDVKPMNRVIVNSLADLQLYLWLLGAFAALALLLAVSGVYAVIACLVAGRTQEFGIRVALGARSRQIVGMVLTHCLGLVLAGSVLGAAGAIAAGRALRNLSDGVTTADLATPIGVAVMLTIAGLAAALAPARRAMQVDAITALQD
ncbi:MAG TPA: ABC transporter permease [Bryobacteraceae bacterium]|nr:ABC transporter permease [Bryobacteraceae bacterium]